MSNGDTVDYSFWRNLSPDIISHILSQLPLKSLCRFKCVSHSWKSLISSPYFVQTHINRTSTNNPQKSILIYGPLALYSLDFAHVNPTAKKIDFPLSEPFVKWFQVLSSCNGLLLISHEGASNFLWNPLTRECKKLPESPFFTAGSVYGFGYDSSTDDYKVVMLASYASFILGRNVAVYSLKTDAWRILQASCFHVEPSPGVHFNERLHWLRRCDHFYVSYGIVAFDLSDEIFRQVPLPALFNCYEIKYPYMAVVGGCLCLLACLSCGRIEVWMMKEYGERESWTRLMTIDNPRMYRVNLLSLLSEEDFVLYFFEGRWVDNKLVVYNTKKETLTDMVIRGIPAEYIVGVPYIKTLFSPIHRGRTDGETM